MLNQGLKTSEQKDRSGARSVTLEYEAANVALDSIGEAVLRTDVRGDVMFLNRMAEKMTGWSREEALGRPVVEVLRIIDGTGGTTVPDAVESAMKEDQTEGATENCSNCILIRRDGVECGIETTFTVVHDRDGAVTGVVVAFHDVTMARARSLEMSHQAQHDALTDLPNRILFNDKRFHSRNDRASSSH